MAQEGPRLIHPEPSDAVAQRVAGASRRVRVATVPVGLASVSWIRSIVGSALTDSLDLWSERQECGMTIHNIPQAMAVPAMACEAGADDVVLD